MCLQITMRRISLLLLSLPFLFLSSSWVFEQRQDGGGGGGGWRRSTAVLAFAYKPPSHQQFCRTRTAISSSSSSLSASTIPNRQSQLALLSSVVLSFSAATRRRTCRRRAPSLLHRPVSSRLSSLSSSSSSAPENETSRPSASPPDTLAENTTTDSKRKEEKEFLRAELQNIASMEEILDELEMDALPDDDDDDYGEEDAGHDDVDDDDLLWTEESIVDFLDILEQDDDEDDTEDQSSDFLDDDDDDDVGDDDEYLEEIATALAAENNRQQHQRLSHRQPPSQQAQQKKQQQLEASAVVDFKAMETRIRLQAAADLECALQQGVVPVQSQGLVGSNALPGDFGFDPLHLAEKDYFKTVQNALLSLIPERDRYRDDDDDDTSTRTTTTTAAANTPTIASPPRPKALILRDYREAEIRHSRLAMLAAVFWPLQEILDKFVLKNQQSIDPEYSYALLWNPPVTLPYFPLLMTAVMLLLGYLDVYSQSIKDMDDMGEAFVPGDCFWDPLCILQDNDARMKRNMQERELFNGRVAMIAIAVYIWEEFITHKALIDIPGNELLLEPAYQVPFIQVWLDAQFSVFYSSQ